MTGARMKEMLADYGFSLSEIANRLGYDNDQRLHSALRSDNIKSSLIEEIAKAINKTVGDFYGYPAPTPPPSSASPVVSGDISNSYNGSIVGGTVTGGASIGPPADTGRTEQADALISQLRKENERLTAQLEAKDKQIEFLQGLIMRRDGT